MDTRKRLLPLLTLALFAWLWVSFTMPTAASTTETDLIDRATTILRRAVSTPSTAIPATVMQRARALAVFPTATDRGAFYVGMGIVSARGATALHWTPPAIVTFQGEIPVRLDVETLDLLLVALTRQGVDDLERPALALTGTNVLVPGPIGQTTLVKMNADLLAYMQFGDYFAGVTVREFAMRQQRDANLLVYGRPYTTAEVFRGGFKVPACAQLWRETIAAHFREMS